MTLETAPPEDLRMDMAALLGALWARALRIVIVTVLLVVATFVVLMFVPKQYESVSSILVEDRSTSFTEAATSTPTGSSGIDIGALLSSQIELIKSHDTLAAVAKQLKLNTIPEFNGSGSTSPLTLVLSFIGRAPAPKSIDETVINNLGDRLTVVRELDSAVISIHARSADPALAAKIANAVAATHVKRRADQSLVDTKTATTALQQQIDTLRAAVQQADTKVADYKAQNNIFAGSNGTALPDQQISDVGKQITDAQAARGTAEQHAEAIRALLKSGASVEGNDDVRASPVVQGLMQNRGTLQATLAEKSATLLPAHPVIKGLKAQIDQIDAQIRAEARRIADGLTAQVAVQDGLISALNDNLKRAQLSASTQTKDGVTLDSLTREAKAQRDLLDAYLLKYRDAQGRVESGAGVPDVRVVAQAVPSTTPASPKTGLILGAVAFVALALQIGTVLFGELMSGRAVYDRTTRAAVEPGMESEPDEVAPDDEVIEEDVAIAAPEPIAADEAEPEPAPETDETLVEAAPGPTARAAVPAIEYAALSADLVGGSTRLVLLGALGDVTEATYMAHLLADDALRSGLTVCRVDAGSAMISARPGITDLCAEAVDFGEVVHAVRDGMVEVPWGRLRMVERRSRRAVTLVEALADIYEVVIVETGPAGAQSNLPVFVGALGKLLLVADPSTTPAAIAAGAAEAEALGFEVAQCLAVPEARSAVA
jgi:uncharacterized protein involved in exopolysaccharide biosynthesis